MANCCFTEYIVEGPKEELQSLYDKMLQVSKMDQPLIKNDWGVTFLGCLVEILGGNWKEVYCRGYFLNLTNNIAESGIIKFDTDTAWVEMAQTRLFLERKYPQLKFYYVSEESGCNYYDSNDTAGKYWPKLNKKYF